MHSTSFRFYDAIEFYTEGLFIQGTFSGNNQLPQEYCLRVMCWHVFDLQFYRLLFLRLFATLKFEGKIFRFYNYFLRKFILNFP